MTATTAPSRSWPTIARIFVYAPAVAGTLPTHNSPLHSKKSGLRVTWCPCVIHRCSGEAGDAGILRDPFAQETRNQAWLPPALHRCSIRSAGGIEVLNGGLRSGTLA